MNLRRCLDNNVSVSRLISLAANNYSALSTDLELGIVTYKPLNIQ